MPDPKKDTFFVVTKDGRYFLSMPATGSNTGWCLVNETCGYEGGIIDGVAVEFEYVKPIDVPPLVHETLTRHLADDPDEDDDEDNMREYMSVVGARGKIKHAIIADDLITRSEAMRVLLAALREGWTNLTIVEYSRERACRR